ncbi:MAG: DoxX family protein [Steroidobacter sp.]
MHSLTHTASVSTKALWTGRILSGLAVVFLLFDSLIKLIKMDVVVESFAQLGYPHTVSRGIGLLELVCIVLYVIPRTSVTGAVLLTGVFGGAIASHLRIGDPVFTHLLFGVYLGAMVWGGLLLRDHRARALIFARS